MPVSRGWSERIQRRIDDEKRFLNFGEVVLMAVPSTIEECDRNRGEPVVELEDAAMPGVRIDDQLRTFDPAMHVGRKPRGHHPVMVAIGNQGGLRERREVRRGRTPPVLDRLEL